MKRTHSRARGVVSAAMLALVLCAGTVFADAYDDLRHRWEEMLDGGDSYSTSDPDIAARITEITDRAQDWWSSIDVTPPITDLWSDLDTSVIGDLQSAFGRLREMALAYSTRGSSLKDNTSLRDAIIAGLDWLYANRYNESTPPYDKWYSEAVTIPKLLNDATVLMYDDLTSTQVGNYMAAIAHFQPSIDYGGANRSEECVIFAVQGVLLKSSTGIAGAVSGMEAVLDYVATGDGFYEDGSYLYHSGGTYPYTGSYGLVQIENTCAIMYLLDGSTWDIQIADPDSSNVYRWIHESFQPILYRGQLMDMASGRSVSRYYRDSHERGHNTIRAIIRAAEFAPQEDADYFRSKVKDWIQSDTYRSIFAETTIADIVAAKAILNDGGIPAPPELVGNFLYPKMERVVHLRPTFGFAITMHSSRIRNYESMNGENLKGWHQGDGMTLIYDKDLARYDDNFWPTVDSYRLPGTTVNKESSTPAGQKGELPFSGGTGIGDYGIAGVQLKPKDQEYSANKSWFMFDDEIVALGSAIAVTEQTGKVLETIIENRKIKTTGDNALWVNGVQKPPSLGWSETMSNVDWIYLSGNNVGSATGYYFPTSPTVEGSRKEETGGWYEINDHNEGVDVEYDRNYLTLWFDHGVNPANAGYAYVLLPNSGRPQTSDYASSPDITVLENSADAHGVRENTLGIVGVNFFLGAIDTVDTITCDKQASVMTTEADGTISVAVADPTHLGSTINLEIDRAAASVISADDGVTVTQLRPAIKLTVDVSGAMGGTFLTTFALPEFREDFEDGFDQWTTVYGTPSVSSAQVKSGDYSFIVNQSMDYIRHYHGSTITNKTVEMWLYDDASDTSMRAVGALYDGTVDAMLGVSTDQSASTYIYRYYGEWYPSPVARSTGWHRLKWIFGAGVDMYIDNVPVGSTTLLDGFDSIAVGDGWNDGKSCTAYFDDIVVREHNYFQEGFEGEFGAWECDLGTPSTSTAQRMEGARSYLVSEGRDRIIHRMKYEMNDIVEVWFYDDASDTSMRVGASAQDATSTSLIGVHTDQSATKYTYRIGSSYYTSSVDRSTGWHKFGWDFASGTGLTMYIDGTLIATTQSLTSFNHIRLGDSWNDGNSGTVYFDGLIVRSNFPHFSDAISRRGCGRFL